MEYSEMELKLISLLYDYSIRGKLADKKYIEQFIDIVVNSMGLNNYLIGFEILSDVTTWEDSNFVSFAGYSHVLKKLYIFIEGINKLLILNDKYRALFSSTEQIFYQNVLISQVILHELEHANQVKIINTNDSLEAKILKFSSINCIVENELARLKDAGCNQKDIEKARQLLTMSYGTLYHIYYELAPGERFAEIKSHNTMIRILEVIKRQTPKLREFESICLLENMTRGYSFIENGISSPTIDFLTLLGKKRELRQFGWYDKEVDKSLFLSQSQFSLSERMIYGLPISNKEHEAVDKIIKMSDKHKI